MMDAEPAAALSALVARGVDERLAIGADRGHPLVRAVGANKTPGLSVVDATAGLGGDALLLAMVGAEVTLVERNATVFAALTETLARLAATAPKLQDALTRMRFHCADSRVFLQDSVADAVVVDPMHPTRKKSALTKLGMRSIRAVVGEDADAAELLGAALGAQTSRVVFKWPRRAPPLADAPKPTFELVGSTTRYAVFQRAGPAKI